MSPTDRHRAAHRHDDVVQVADRRHLMHNLSEAVRKVVAAHRRWPRLRVDVPIAEP